LADELNLVFRSQADCAERMMTNVRALGVSPKTATAPV